MLTEDELRRILDGATPGPWEVGFWGGQCYEDHQHDGDSCNYRPEPLDWLGCVRAASDVIVVDGDPNAEEDGPSHRDAKLIALAPTLAANVLRVLERHTRGTIFGYPDNCAECLELYPCKLRRTLLGEDDG